MANIYSLDSLRDAAQEDFADMVIPVSEERSITLLNPLRLSEDQRTELKTYFEQVGMGSADEDGEESEQTEERDDVTLFDAIKAILVRVASDRKDGEFLIETIGDDNPLLMTVFTRWNEQTQAGEA